MRIYGERTKVEKRTTWTTKPYHYIAIVFSRFPFIVLFLTFLLAFLGTWFGLLNYGFPEFEDPYLGFETRKTVIANRLAAQANLRTEFERLEIIENYPGERMSSRDDWKRRRRDPGSNQIDYCGLVPQEEHSRIALELHPNSSLFSIEILKRICFFEKLLEKEYSYQFLCEKDGIGHCCPAWSLPNYISLQVNIADCSDMTEAHVEAFFQNFTICVDIYNNDTTIGKCSQFSEKEDDNSECPFFCARGGIIEAAITHTVDKSYFSSNVTRFAMIVLPVPKNQILTPPMEDFLKFLSTINFPDDVVFFGGYDFGIKDALFKDLLVSDLVYVIIASVVIFIIVCCYTKSFFVTAISFGALTLSLGISYFLYNAVLRIPYFPFMNMLVTIIVLGIGTDGTLIISSAWRRCRSNLKDEPFDKKLKLSVMEETIKETTSTLFITTCTTAGAFFASLTSSITTIRCFSIFAGTAILVSFILLYICVPTALLISDIVWVYICALMTDPEDSTFIPKLLLLGKKFESFKQFFLNAIFRVKFNKILKLLTATKFAIITFTVFSGILIWGSCAVLYSPGFELPISEQFQLLSYNHPIERFDREVEPHFTAQESEYEKLSIYFIWGVKDIDNGATLNPNDKGFLDFDMNFSMEDKTSQNWTRYFCNKLKQLPFYDLEANLIRGAYFDSCFIEWMEKWMNRDCEETYLAHLPSRAPCCKTSTFPYEPTVFSKCVGNYSQDVYRTPSQFFTPDIAGPKFFTTFMNKNRTSGGPKNQTAYPEESSAERMGKLATVTIRIKTNFTNTLSYDKMSKFYSEIDQFFTESLKDAPEPLKGGFFVSSNFDFFDLQHSLLNDTWQSLLLSTGICFIFIWISSGRFLVSFGAMLTILATVVVSSALLIQLFSWKLGVFESIAVTVAVGLSDFTAHHAIEFAKRKSILEMTSPTFFAACTTIIMGLSMLLFSDVLVYQQIGAFFFVLVCTSWLYSVFFLNPLLLLFHHVFSRITKYLGQYSITEFIHSWRKKKSDNNFVTNRPLRATKTCECPAKDSCDCYNFVGTSDELVENEIVQGNEKNMCESAKDQTLMIEKIKLLKKIAQETTV